MFHPEQSSSFFFLIPSCMRLSPAVVTHEHVFMARKFSTSPAKSMVAESKKQVPPTTLDKENRHSSLLTPTAHGHSLCLLSHSRTVSFSVALGITRQGCLPQTDIPSQHYFKMASQSIDSIFRRQCREVIGL